MNKLLTTKTQQLSPIPTISDNVISKTVVVEPEDKNLVLKKGTVYAVYTLKDSRGFDHSLISKVIYDVLSNDYYQTESISPIQSLEKIILGIRDKLAKLSNESISEETHEMGFDMIAAVLWGNVMYITKYGNGRVILMRNSEIRELETLTEGGFSVTSGIIKDEDVIILCTEKFFENYPPNKLMSAPVGEKDLSATEACILIKMKLDTTLSSTEQVDFGLGVEKSSGIKSLFVNQVKDRLHKITEKRNAQKQESLQTIAAPTAKLNINIPKQLNKEKPLDMRISRKPRAKITPVVLIPLVVVALILSISVSVKKSQQKILDAVETPTEQVIEQKAEETPQPVTDPEAFYDIKITDNNASPEEIAVVGTSVVVSDNSHGFMYTSNIDTPKFTKTENTYSKIGALGIQEGNLVAITESGFKVYSSDFKEIATYTGIGTISQAAYYLDFIYSVEGDNIVKYTKGTASEELTSTEWGASSDFEGAKDLTVAYSIWLITKDNTIVKYTGGEKDTFSLTEANKPENPVAIVTNIDFDNLYIADRAKNKVLVFDKEGTFSKEYASDKWTDIKAISITSDEKTLFVLSGSRVYKVSL